MSVVAEMLLSRRRLRRVAMGESPFEYKLTITLQHLDLCAKDMHVHVHVH